MDSQNRGAPRQGQQGGFLGEALPSLSLGGIGQGGRWCKTFLRDISPGPSKCSAAGPLPGPASPTNRVREAGSTGLLLPTSPKPSEAGRGKPCHAERLSTVRKGALESEHMTWSPVPVPPLTHNHDSETRKLLRGRFGIGIKNS